MNKFTKTFGIAVAVAGLLLVALLWSVGAMAAPAQPGQRLAPDASITLSNAPSPPTALRPGETQSIQWQIIASTTPMSVSFRITNLDTSALVESQVYPGATGMSVVRGYTLPLSYTLPFGQLFERYRIQVVYYSLQSGNEASAEANFWVTQDTGSLRVVKFNDRNGNGVRDPGDEGVPGVLFRLLIQGQTLGEITDANGEILWTDVPIGSYQVTELVPPGFVATTPNPVTAQVTANTTSTVLFGNRIIPGALEALVFVDADGDGVQDPGDLPYQGATASFISPCGDGASGVSNAAGLVIWPDRCVGSYSIQLTVPANYVATTPATVAATVTSSVTSRVSFGIQGRGALRACKFNDRNGNGVRDPDDPSVAGVSMTYLNQFGATGSGVTGGDGCITWPQVAAGSYAVSEQVPPDCQVTTSPYPPETTVVAGQTAQVQIGNRCFGALVARAFEDLNGNGVWDTGEPPLGGVPVSWVNEFGESDFDVTGASGSLTWSPQAAGIYTVTAAVLPDYAATTAQSQPAAVNVGGATTLDFGQRLNVACVEGRKVDDFHIGLPGWVIRAQLADGSGPIYRLVSDSTGYFRFDALPLGVYRFWEELQTGWTAVTPAEFEVAVLEPGEECLQIRFKNKQATPTPAPPAQMSDRLYLPLLIKGLTGRWEERSRAPGDATPTPQGAGCVVGTKVDDLLVGLPGWTISLQGASGPARLTITDGLGQFRFDGVPPGQYLISETAQQGWAPVGPAAFVVNVAAGSQCTTAQFRNRQATATPTATNTPTSTPTPTATPTATPQPPPIIRDVPSPKGIAVNPQTNMIFIGSKSTGRLYRVNGATNTVQASYPSGSEPFGVAVNSMTNKVYVANYASNTVTIFNGASGALLATVNLAPLGAGQPSYVAVDEALNRVYVTLHSGGRVAVIDGVSNALLANMEAQAGAFGVAVHPGLQRAYVSNRDAGTINVFDTSTNTRLWPQTFTPMGTPYGLAVDPVRNRLYVLYALTGGAPDRVAVYSLAASGASRIDTVLVEDGGAQGGTGIAVNPTTGHVFVANSARNTVSVIDGPSLSVLASVAVGRDPGMVGVNPATNKVYVSNRGDNTVQVIDDTFVRRPRWQWPVNGNQ